MQVAPKWTPHVNFPAAIGVGHLPSLSDILSIVDFRPELNELNGQLRGAAEKRPYALASVDDIDASETGDINFATTRLVRSGTDTTYYCP